MAAGVTSAGSATTDRSESSAANGRRGRAAVIGAGLAGLSAALELKRLGFEVDLVERSRLLGGKATSFEIDGVEVDNGQHVYLACCTEFIDFVESLETQPLLQLQKRFEALLLARGRKPAVLRANPRLRAPYHLAFALLRYHHLSFRARLGVARALLKARDDVSPAESFAAWLSRHGQGPDTRKAFWDPFFVPALNARLEDVSAEAGVFVIRTAFLSDSGACRFGFARVPLARIAERAAARLDRVHLRTVATGLITRVEDGDELLLRGVELDAERTLECDGVVAALPPDRLAKLLGDPARFGLAGLDAFKAAPIVDVHLWYERALASFGFAAVLDSPVQWVFEKGPGYLCCSMSAAEEYVSRPSKELVEICHSELTTVLPELRHAALIRGAATRDRDATFVPRPGLRRPGPTTAAPQLTIAGAWTGTGWPATMESAIRSGRVAARALSNQLSVVGSQLRTDN